MLNVPLKLQTVHPPPLDPFLEQMGQTTSAGKGAGNLTVIAVLLILTFLTRC